MNSGVATRVSAARVLDAVLHRGSSLKASLAAELPALADPRDRAMVEAIVFAALRQRTRFDAALSQWLPKPLGQRDHEVRALLHAGFAQQALGMPAHAVIAASVDAARALGRPHQAGLVNALLRRAQRDGGWRTNRRRSSALHRLLRRPGARRQVAGAGLATGEPAAGLR